MLEQATVADVDLVQALEAVIANTSFASFLGAKILSASPGNVELAVDVRPDVMNQHHGFVHGAVMGFVADSACAWAAGTVAGDVVTAEYKLHFLAPAVGTRIIGRGRVIKSSSRILVAQADVFSAKNDSEKLVAVALATIVRVERKPEIGGRTK
jgi:uncharacterized protein (TIGR00369 family)